MARQMLQRMFAAEVPAAWVTMDEAYGQAKSLRVWLEDHDQAHVVATRCNDDVVTTSMGRARVVEQGAPTCPAVLDQPLGFRRLRSERPDAGRGRRVAATSAHAGVGALINSQVPIH